MLQLILTTKSYFEIRPLKQFLPILTPFTELDVLLVLEMNLVKRNMLEHHCFPKIQNC